MTLKHKNLLINGISIMLVFILFFTSHLFLEYIKQNYKEINIYYKMVQKVHDRKNSLKVLISLKDSQKFEEHLIVWNDNSLSDLMNSDLKSLKHPDMGIIVTLKQLMNLEESIINLQKSNKKLNSDGVENVDFEPQINIKLDSYGNLIKILNENVDKLEEDLSKLMSQNTISVYIVNSAILLIILFASVITHLYINRAIISPIIKLRDCFKNISVNEKEVPLHLRSCDEIGELSTSFNNLYNSLQEIHQSLEKKVHDRTEELTLINEQLKKLDLLKNNLIKNISIDITNPLTNILNISIDLLNRGHNSDCTEISNIYHSSLRLKININRFIELVNMNAQTLPLVITGEKLDHFFKKIVKEYSNLLSTTNFNVQLQLKKSTHTYFYSDFDKIEQILDNMVFFILKLFDVYERRNIILLVELEEGKTKILIDVPDLEIESFDIEEIIEKLKDIHLNNISENSDIDLSLFYAYELIRYLSGELRFSNNKDGNGIFIHIEIPDMSSEAKEICNDDTKEEQHVRYFSEFRKLIQTELVNKIQCKNEIQKQTVSNEKTCNLSNAHILVIDDDISILFLINQILSEYGYKNIMTAQSGKEALSILSNTPVDLILTDYSMPVISGMDLLDIIRTDDKYNMHIHVPIIFISAISNKQIILDLMKKGIVDFLVKPFDIEELVILVEQNLIRYFELQKTISLTTYDELTGLYSRKEIMKRVSELLAIRKFSDHAIIFCDIDHFKNFNDTYGHQIGDLVLSKTAHMIKNSLRQYDSAGRYGGEEILLLLPYTTSEQAICVAKKIQNCLLENPVEYDGQKLSVTMSYGISSLSSNREYICETLDINDLEELICMPLNFSKQRLIELKTSLKNVLITMADNALYTAKRTLCKHCGFESEKEIDFQNGVCKSCGNDALEIGRNKIAVFKKNDKITEKYNT